MLTVSEELLVSDFVHGPIHFRPFSIGDPALPSSQWPTYTLLYSNSSAAQFSCATRAFNTSCALRGNALVLKHDNVDGRLFIDFTNVGEAFEVCHFVANAFDCM